MPVLKDDDLMIEPQYNSTPSIGEPVSWTDPLDMGINILSNKDSQRGDVIHYLRGYQWKVDYYNNLSGVNEKTSVCSTVLDKSVQKYNLLENLIIYMDSPIAPNGNIEELTGNGVINAGLIPRINDHFKAIMVDNRIGIFRITDAKNKTYQYHDVYEIEFKFHLFATDNNEFIQDLNNKVVETYAYDENFIQEYGTPMIIKSELNDKINLRTSRERLIRQYFSLFVDNETCFLNPFGRDPDKQGNLLLVDGLFNKFINRTIEMSRTENNLKLKDFDYAQNPNLFRTILDALIEKDSEYIFSTQHNLTWTNIERTTATPASRNLWYLGVNGVVDLISEDDVIRNDINKNLLFQRPKHPDTMTITYPLLLEDNKLDYYIFDQCFYEEDLMKLTKFQHVVKRFLSGEKINQDDISIYVHEWRYWSKYEQYYIIPILLLIIKSILPHSHRGL